MVCIFVVLFQSNDSSKRHTHTHTHTHTHRWRRRPCRAPAAHQEQFGVQYLARGHFDMQLGGAGIRTGDLPITRPFYAYCDINTLLCTFKFIAGILYFNTGIFKHFLAFEHFKLLESLKICHVSLSRLSRCYSDVNMDYWWTSIIFRLCKDDISSGNIRCHTE